MDVVCGLIGAGVKGWHRARLRRWHEDGNGITLNRDTISGEKMMACVIGGTMRFEARCIGEDGDSCWESV
eukprot:4734032-Ditylum_brightwellii.AAC.2